MLGESDGVLGHGVLNFSLSPGQHSVARHLLGTFACSGSRCGCSQAFLARAGSIFAWHQISQRSGTRDRRGRGRRCQVHACPKRSSMSDYKALACRRGQPAIREGSRRYLMVMRNYCLVQHGSEGRCANVAYDPNVIHVVRGLLDPLAWWDLDDRHIGSIDPDAEIGEFAEAARQVLRSHAQEVGKRLLLDR